MLRRDGPLLTALALIMLVATACLVRTGRPARGNSYRSAPAENHKQHEHEQHRKHRKHR